LNISFASAAEVSDGLPDSNRTPGAIDTRVTQDNISSTICLSGYTTKVRPTSTYTTTLKLKQLSSGYAINGITDKSKYEEDHLVPLELGGSPKSEENLWPQLWDGVYGARAKDKLENKLHDLVCKNLLRLEQAQNAISNNWVDAYDWFVNQHEGTISADSWQKPSKSIISMNFSYAPSRSSSGLQNGDSSIGSLTCFMDKVHQIDLNTYGIKSWNLNLGSEAESIQWNLGDDVQNLLTVPVSTPGAYSCTTTVSGDSGVIALIKGSLEIVDPKVQVRASSVQQDLKSTSSQTMISNEKPTNKTNSPQIAVKVFKNCTELNAAYPGGVALPGAVNSGGKTSLTPFYDQSIYMANKKSDRDNDGIACEK
jgi:hypothetical protein